MKKAAAVSMKRSNEKREEELEYIQIILPCLDIIWSNLKLMKSEDKDIIPDIIKFDIQRIL